MPGHGDPDCRGGLLVGFAVDVDPGEGVAVGGGESGGERPQTARQLTSRKARQVVTAFGTADESAALIGAVTDAVVGFTGERILFHTWVVVREVKSGQWGIGGTARGRPDVRATSRARQLSLDRRHGSGVA